MDPAISDYIPVAPVDDEAKKHNQNLPGMGGVYNNFNLQLYHYAGNNPVKYTDPDGRTYNGDETYTADDNHNTVNKMTDDFNKRWGTNITSQQVLDANGIKDEHKVQKGQVVDFNSFVPTDSYSVKKNIIAGVTDICIGLLLIVLGGYQASNDSKTGDISSKNPKEYKAGTSSAGPQAIVLGLSLGAIGITRLVPNGKTDGNVLTDMLEAAEEPFGAAVKELNELKKKDDEK